MVSGLVSSTRPSASSIRTAVVTSASRGVSSPVASGRRRVRLTWPSILRSAKSLMAQPAERVSTVPSVKMHSRPRGGMPSAANHSAHSIGHSSRKIPIGRSSRVRRTRAVTLWRPLAGCLLAGGSGPAGAHSGRVVNVAAGLRVGAFLGQGSSSRSIVARDASIPARFPVTNQALCLTHTTTI